MELLSVTVVVLLSLCAVALLTAAHRAFWRRHFRLQTCEDEVHRVVCEDGWEIRLYRYRGRSEAPYVHNPVVLCHGYCANRFNVDFHPDVSLARYLHGQGWDVWVMELRGCADATRRPPEGVKRGSVQFEDFVDLDIPAAVAHVMEHTGSQGVHWVGHSLGGMIALAFAQGPMSGQLKSVTAIGSPCQLDLSPAVDLLCRASWLLGWLSELPVGFLSQMAAPWYHWIPFDPVAVRLANVSAGRVRRAMSNVLSDMPMTLTRQLAKIQINGGAVVSARDDRDFTAGLSRIERPLLCIAGSDDRVAPPANARMAVDKAVSARTRWVLIGGQDTIPGYGHGDLLIGDRAPEHVFVHVGQWLLDSADDDGLCNAHSARADVAQTRQAG